MDIQTNVHKILENFEVMDLPSVPQVLVELIEACYRVDSTVEQLAHWIEMDPGLSARALALIGARGARPRSRLDSFPELAAGLGRDGLKALAVSAATRAAGAETGAVSLGFWHRSVHCAVTARLLAVATAYRSPDEAYLAGLLHNVGQLVFESIHPREYSGLRRKARRDTQLLLLEREQFGAGHNDVGAQLIESWGLNSFLADAARYHHQPLGYVLDAHPLVRIVFLASLLSHAETRPSETAFDAAEQLFALGQAALSDLIAKADEAVAGLRRTLDLTGGRDAESVGADPRAADRRLARAVARIALLDGIRPRLNRATDRAALLEAIRHGARVILAEGPSLFFFLDPEGEVLIGESPGSDDDLVAELRIRAEASGSLVSRCLTGHRVVHSLDEETPPLTVIDRQIIGHLDTAGMLCVPLIGDEIRLGALVVGVEREQSPRIEESRDVLQAFAAEAATQLASIMQRAAGTTTPGERNAADARTRQIVHEVNNPLSIARNYLQVLGMKLGSTHPASKDLKVIEEELVRVSELVLQLTEAPGAPGPPVKPERETVTLNGLITDLVRVSRESLFLPKQIEVELALDEELPPILSSASSLKQILINLVQNASEAMTEGGRLRIRTRDWHRVDETPFVEIEITDNGPGIPTEIQQRLFEPLTSAKGRGHAGLGLSIVKRLVEDLGGSIGYQSNEHEGTTFRVLLPRVLGERRASAKPG